MTPGWPVDAARAHSARAARKRRPVGSGAWPDLCIGSEFVDIGDAHHDRVDLDLADLGAPLETCICRNVREPGER